MVRKLAIAAFALSALSSGVAQALGLGEATVQSSLNQPLTAEIELVNIRDLEDNEILTGLAGREEFSRAGVDRVFFLSDLRFKVELNQDGKAVIKVTSSKPVREPFLNFLVEVNWPSGRLLREYALLIDPPTFTEERAAPVQLPAAPARTQSAAPAAPARQPVRSRVAQTDSAGTVNGSANTYDSGSYGPTIANDTLWSIALKTRPDRGVSPQKMMLAIQDLNPDAFLNNNINRLKKGQLLRLPTSDQIDTRTSREAIAEVVAQNEVLQAGPAKTADSPGQQQDAAASSSQARDELRIVVDEATDSIKGSPSSSGSGNTTTGTGRVAGSADEALVQEQLDLTNRENEELKGRLEELQQQLETMQRLVSLKNDQLAALQGETALELSEQEQGEGSDDLLAGLEASGTAGEDPGSALPTDGDDSNVAMTGQDVASASGTNALADNSARTAGSTQQMAVPAREAEVLATPSEPVSWVDRTINNFKTNVVYQGALAAGGVLLLLLLWLMSRRKSEGQEEFDEVALQDQSIDSAPATRQVAAGAVLPGDDGTDPLAEADVYLAYQKHDQAARVLESALEEHPDNQDYRLKLLEVLGESRKVGKFVGVLAALEATGDADILERASNIKARFSDLTGEADVSLDDLESQLLSGDSIGTDHDLDTAGLADDFELDVDISESASLDDTVRKSEAAADFLEKNDFDLGSEAEIDVDDDLDIDFDLSDIDLEDNEASRGDLSADLGDIDFGKDDLDLSGDDFKTSSALTGSEEDIVNGPASAEVSFDMDSPAADGLTPAGDLELDEDFAGLDKFEGLAAEQNATAAAEATDAADDNDGLDLDLDDIDIALDEAAESSFDDLPVNTSGDGTAHQSSLSDIDSDDTVNLFPEDKAIDLDSTIDSSLDDTIAQPMPDAAQTGSDEDIVTDIEDDFDFLSDTDEAATKLDLARAYVDMGDNEGARDILEEVAEEGSDEQKQEAVALLKSLG